MYGNDNDIALSPGHKSIVYKRRNIFANQLYRGYYSFKFREFTWDIMTHNNDGDSECRFCNKKNGHCAKPFVRLDGNPYQAEGYSNDIILGSPSKWNKRENANGPGKFNERDPVMKFNTTPNNTLKQWELLLPYTTGRAKFVND